MKKRYNEGLNGELQKKEKNDRARLSTAIKR